MEENELNDLRSINDWDKFMEHLKTQDIKVVDENEDLKRIVEELKAWDPCSFDSRLNYLTVRWSFRGEDLKSLAGIMMKFIADLISEKERTKILQEKVNDLHSIIRKTKEENRELINENDSLHTEISVKSNTIWNESWRIKFKKRDAEYRKLYAEYMELRMNGDKVQDCLSDMVDELETKYREALAENERLRSKKVDAEGKISAKSAEMQAEYEAEFLFGGDYFDYGIDSTNKDFDLFEEDDSDVSESSIDDNSEGLDLLGEDLIAKVFEVNEKYEVHAHAYNERLSNLKMKELREKGLTYREIGKQLNCSPSTVRNRLKTMEGE